MDGSDPPPPEAGSRRTKTRLISGIVLAALAAIMAVLYGETSFGEWISTGPSAAFAGLVGLLLGFIASPVLLRVVSLSQAAARRAGPRWSRFTTWFFARQDSKEEEEEDGRSTSVTGQLQRMRPSYRWMLITAQVLAGMICTVLGILVLFPDLFVYREISGRLSHPHLSFWVPSPPDYRYVTGEWRARHNLPPRLHISSIDADQLRWQRVLEPGIWPPEPPDGEYQRACSIDSYNKPINRFVLFCMDEDLPHPVVPQIAAGSLFLCKRKDFSDAVSAMLVQRTGSMLGAPDAFVPLRVATISAALMAVSAFLLLAAAVRVWLLLPLVRHRRSRAHLLSATVLAMSVLCVVPKLLYTCWAFQHIPFDLEDLLAFRFEPWSLMQRFVAYESLPAAWSLLTAILCWFSVVSMATALRSASRYSPLAGAYATRFIRLVVWSIPVVCTAYVVLSALLGRLIEPDMLLPAAVYRWFLPA